MKKLRILLSEDDEFTQHITSHYLKKIGHEVDIAGNGFEAVQKFRSKKYDIIIMDIQMPEMDGLEATREIRKLEHMQYVPGMHIPIIAFTSNPNEEECRSAGIDEYAQKPLNPEQFQKLFNSYNLT